MSTAVFRIEGFATAREIQEKWARHVLELCDGDEILAARTLRIARETLRRRLGMTESRGPRGRPRKSLGPDAKTKAAPMPTARPAAPKHFSFKDRM